MTKAQDRQFEDKHIAKVHKEDGGWSIDFKEGASFWVPGEPGIEPKAGMTARLYGKGFGFVVRGLDLDGREVFYRTADEEERRYRKEVAAQKHKQADEFERDKDEYMARVAALPVPFQRRIEKFTRTKGDSWWPDFGPYELFCCEQAWLYARILKTPGKVKEMANARHADQKALLLAACTTDDDRKAIEQAFAEHSGNTFAFACRLAVWFTQRPETVVLEHGALSILVGCPEYGCPHPPPDDILVYAGIDPVTHKAMEAIR